MAFSNDYFDFLSEVGLRNKKCLRFHLDEKVKSHEI